MGVCKVANYIVAELCGYSYSRKHPKIITTCTKTQVEEKGEKVHFISHVPRGGIFHIFAFPGARSR